MKKIVLFGAGQIGRLALMTLDLNKYEEVLFCDNDSSKNGTFYLNKKIIDFITLKQLCKDELVEMILLTAGKWRDIYVQCFKSDIPLELIKCFHKDFGYIMAPVDCYVKYVYSQEGEELFLRERFIKKEKGIYVDVGANHPWDISNTYWAYKKGWRGINIEPNVIGYKLLQMGRPEDRNYNCGIAEENGELTYYEFEDSCCNTFCKDEITDKRLVATQKIEVRRLDSILEECGVKEIDFLDIDVEGMEMSVLKSIDWDKVYIEYILLEQRRLDLAGVLESEECKFLAQKGYIPSNKFHRTVIYELKKDIYF